MIWQIIHIIDIALWLFMAASAIYILFFALVSTLWKKRVSKLTTYLTGQVLAMRKKDFFSYLILYPAYNEDRVIVNSVQKFLAQYYPYDSFHVAVISDHMQPETNQKLAELPITLLLPVFDKSSKAKAMQYAMDHFQKSEVRGQRSEDFDYIKPSNAIDALKTMTMILLYLMASARKSITPFSVKPIIALVFPQH